MVRAMDVDVAVVGVDVAAEVHAGLQSAQPEDARGDQAALLLLGREFGEMLAGGDARLEHDAGRLAGAVLLRDLVQAARRAEGILHVGGWAARGGDDVGLHQTVVRVKSKQLLRNGYGDKTRCRLESERGAPLFGPFKRSIHGSNHS